MSAGRRRDVRPGEADLRTIAADYAAAISRLADLQDEHPGVVGRVADRAGVSRRRIWITDPLLQQAVVRAVQEENSSRCHALAA